MLALGLAVPWSAVLITFTWEYFPILTADAAVVEQGVPCLRARLFAMFAVVVRRGIADQGGLPEVTLDDFPIVPADDRSLDLLAVCRRPRTAAQS